MKGPTQFPNCQIWDHIWLAATGSLLGKYWLNKLGNYWQRSRLATLTEQTFICWEPFAQKLRWRRNVSPFRNAETFVVTQRYMQCRPNQRPFVRSTFLPWFLPTGPAAKREEDEYLLCQKGHKKFPISTQNYCHIKSIAPDFLEINKLVTV